MDQNQLEKMIKEIMVSISTEQKDTKSTCSCGSNPCNCSSKVTYANYPLGEKSADKLKTPTGKNVNEVTLEAVLNGSIKSNDVRITPETLEMQAQVADSIGRNAFAENLRRAAELIAIPDDRILKMYDALRPYRSTKAELLEMAEELENKYNAKITSSLVREAAEVGEARGRLKT